MLESIVLPEVRTAFTLFPQLQSASMLVAQYWCDEAIDAVHYMLVHSVLQTPDLEAAFGHEDDDEPDRVNLPEPLPTSGDLWWRCREEGRQIGKPVWWDDNGEAIPAFAAFCREGAHQEMSRGEAYAPYAILRRAGDDIEVEVVGQMLRPWLDGVAPENF